MVRLRDSWPFSLSSAPTVGNPCRPLQPESVSVGPSAVHCSHVALSLTGAEAHPLCPNSLARDDSLLDPGCPPFTEGDTPIWGRAEGHLPSQGPPRTDKRHARHHWRGYHRGAVSHRGCRYRHGI